MTNWCSQQDPKSGFAKPSTPLWWESTWSAPSSSGVPSTRRT